jgi:hypothetical protein
MLIIKRIVFLDFIHRLVSQEQTKLRKLKIIDKRTTIHTSTNKSHKDGVLVSNELCFSTLSIARCLKNKQNWGIKNIDKISQYTRPQKSHKGQLLTTEQPTWAHTRINPWSKSDTGGNKRLCLCAIVCLCDFVLVFWPPLRVVVCE